MLLLLVLPLLLAVLVSCGDRAEVEGTTAAHTEVTTTARTPYWRQCPEHIGYTTYWEHLEFFTQWLTRRLAFLDGEFNKTP